ncbi:MAG: 3-deoxy-D-manno-octulosonic acid transferase [Planctomycetota bacterium]|jgi:3-deoxy-D-manno-octulosonic-acid transferase
MGLLLDILYAVGIIVASPMWLVRMIRHGRYRRGYGQRLLGGVPVSEGDQPTIWIHGVSLGEINAARTLVAELHSQLPDYRVVVSSTTDTGMAAAEKNLGSDHAVFRWPMDFSLVVQRALGRVRPALVVLMEGEAWPNFLAACNRRDIPAVIVNARLGADKGYPRYRKLGPLAAQLFNRLTMIGAQTDQYAESFRSLGVLPEKLCVTGMMKFDSAEITDRLDGQDDLAAALGLKPEEQLIVAGGTGRGEEAIVLGLWRQLKADHPNARLGIIPRKPERFDEVARLIRSTGARVIRRTYHPDGSETVHDGDAIILGDTMGELRKYYALASAVFVGRSLVPKGGSDMIEAAGLGRPIAFGPHTFNFPQADDLANNGAVRVADEHALAAQLDEWLTNPAEAEEAGQAAQTYVISQRGATQRNVEMIRRVLTDASATNG